MAAFASGCRLVLAAVVASACVTSGLSLQQAKSSLEQPSQHVSQSGQAPEKLQQVPPLPYNASAPTNLTETLSMLNDTVEYISVAVDKFNETLNTKLLAKFYNATTALNGILVGMQATVDTLANVSADMNQSDLTDPYLQGVNSTIASLKESLNATNETLPLLLKNLSAGLSVGLEAIQNQTDQISALLGGVQAAADIADSILNITSGGKSTEGLKQDPEEPKAQATALCDQANEQLVAAAEKVPEYTEQFTTLNETLMTTITTFVESSNTTLSSMNTSIAEQMESGSLPDSLATQLALAQSLVGALQETFAAVTDVLLTTVLPNVSAVVTPLLASAPDYVAWAQQVVDTACAFPLIGGNSTPEE